MSASDKISAAGDKLKGNVKEAAGRATGDDSKVAEGKLDQAKGDMKQAGANAKDSAKDVFDK